MATKSLDKIPWDKLTPEQKTIRRICLSVLDEMRLCGCPLNKVKLPDCLTMETFIDNVRSALFEVDGYWHASHDYRIQLEARIITRGQVKSIIVDRPEYLHEISWYFCELLNFYRYRGHFIKKQMRRFAREFKGKRVIDIHGNSYTFETRVAGLDQAFDDVKRGEFYNVFQRCPAKRTIRIERKNGKRVSAPDQLDDTMGGRASDGC